MLRLCSPVHNLFTPSGHLVWFVGVELGVVVNALNDYFVNRF